MNVKTQKAMEQYWMPKEDDCKNLQTCLEHYTSDHIFIRLKGASGGTIKVNEKLTNKTLHFKQTKKGLDIYIDKQEIFHFPLQHYEKGFSLAYERFESTKNGIEKLICLSNGQDPYDKTLPEPKRSFLRTVLDNHLMEIAFNGRIHIAFHSWWEKPHTKYWKVVPPQSL